MNLEKLQIIKKIQNDISVFEIFKFSRMFVHLENKKKKQNLIEKWIKRKLKHLETLGNKKGDFLKIWNLFSI